MEQGQTAGAAHGYSFEEAVWYYYDWWKRDPYTALKELAREARAGTYRGKPLCERVMVAMAAEHDRMCGNFTDEFTIPERPARFERRTTVRLGPKPTAAPRKAVPTARAPAPTQAPAAPAPRPRMTIPKAR